MEGRAVEREGRRDRGGGERAREGVTNGEGERERD